MPLPAGCNIQDLPTEILDEIVKAAPRPTQLAFLTVSPLFYELALRQLYHTVEFAELSQIAAFYNTVTHYPRRAELIKRLNVQLYVEPREFEISSTPLNQIVHRLTKLEVFCINIHSVPADTTEAIIRSCQSLSLRELTCYSTPLSASILADFCQAQSLTALRLSMQASASTEPLSFPSLKEFSGPAEVFAQMAVAMPLVSAHLSWAYVRDPDYETHVAMIERACGQTLCSLSCFTHGSGASLLEVISRRLPQLQELSITFDQPLTVPHTEELELKIESCLGQFKSLVSFSYASHWRTDPTNKPTRQLLNHVRERCPSLRKCRLYENYWERHGDHDWFDQHS
ncbi:hypothetical protein HGRIS_014116 [Hohenbuehelia grisea]|uniref:F-box domain-containing protein n=1 Tax=Hohenbuehelia grisea TaxID=104357 RepID=A0ABR3JUK1_9AGAR